MICACGLPIVACCALLRFGGAAFRVSPHILGLLCTLQRTGPILLSRFGQALQRETVAKSSENARQDVSGPRCEVFLVIGQ